MTSLEIFEFCFQDLRRCMAVIILYDACFSLHFIMDDWTLWNWHYADLREFHCDRSKPDALEAEILRQSVV